MSKIKFLLALCLLMPAYAKAETWNCNFRDTNGENANLPYRKWDGEYYLIIDGTELPVSKTFEDDKYLHLVVSYQADMVVTVIDKETETAASIFLTKADGFEKTAVEGVCDNY